MRTKDQLLLEEAYQKIYLEENDYYVNLNGDVVKKHKDHKITLGGKSEKNFALSIYLRRFSLD
jgi:hypothetical protein